MALTAYLAATRRLLQNPQAPTSLYSDSDLTSYINTARGQIAGENECIRNAATLALVAAQRVYLFSAITLGSPSTGIQGVLNVRMAAYQVGNGERLMRTRGFEYFKTYFLNKPVQTPGPPAEWAQYGQGASGSLYVSPLPDGAYTLNLDTVCRPIDLADDTTAEAIPYPWTDCVPFFAAYYAYLGSQVPARSADAERMFQRYEEFAARARVISNPTVQPYIYPRSGDPTKQNKLGLQPRNSDGSQGQ